MRKLIILLFLVACPAIVFAQPEIKFDAENVDLGEIEGQSVTHTFEFKNTGTQELVVHKIVPSCGCTTALVSSTKVKSGETGKIKATLNVGEMSGKITKPIRVYTNDPSKTEITLFLTVSAKKKSK